MQAKNINGHLTEIRNYFKMAVSVDCVIFGFDNDQLKVLLIASDLHEFKDKWSLLGDIVHPDEELEAAAYRVLKTRTGLDHVYMEQVGTFGGVHRHPAGRVVTVAYYSLVNIEQNTLKNHRNDLHWCTVKDVTDMAFDHLEILHCCHERLKHKIIEQPVGFNLLPKKFSLRELQNLYEAILDVKLDRRNFRKKFLSMDLLVDLHEEEDDVPHRPARLYKFNFEKYDQQKKRDLGIGF
ncbi:MAG TPA: NUDIX domain-containing protein [Chitinophaga sp.]|uniref:NUDIX hydrolase n=1 Tax=Chitinophaga sp. TaxID=1869181 RepID=UPI002DBD9090|nr:NUDIX domain-containing protein [Chitinophaga sp.]HEU4551749.1 NUDIX domain-containing protein [Chitinophaga sp.]